MEGFFNLPKVRRKAIPPPVGVASAAAALHSRRRSNLIHLPERNASIPWAIRMPMLRIMKVPASAAYIPSPSLSVLNGSTAYTIKTICQDERGSRPADELSHSSSLATSGTIPLPTLFEFGTGFLPPETDAPKGT